MAEATYYGTGRRKTSVARVRLVPGQGNIVINGRELKDYFDLKTLELIIKQPLELTGTTNAYDVIANVKGGGRTGQAGAIRHGISRALLEVDEMCIRDRDYSRKCGTLPRRSEVIFPFVIPGESRRYNRHSRSGSLRKEQYGADDCRMASLPGKSEN